MNTTRPISPVAASGRAIKIRKAVTVIVGGASLLYILRNSVNAAHDFEGQKAPMAVVMKMDQGTVALLHERDTKLYKLINEQDAARLGAQQKYDNVKRFLIARENTLQSENLFTLSYFCCAPSLAASSLISL